MILQHVMKLVEAGYTKDEIEAMTIEDTPKVEDPKVEDPKVEEPKVGEPKGFSIDYDKLSQSMMKAFQSANIKQIQQPQQEKSDLSKFF